MNQISDPIVLWGVGISPYVRKVMVALHEKQLAYQQNEILPKAMLVATGQAIPEGFDERVSPLGKIPAIEVDGMTLADSAVIAAYLDRRFSTGTALYPESPQAYARARWFEQYSDVELTRVGYRKVFVECVVKPLVLKQAADDAVVAQALTTELPPLLAYLDGVMREQDWLAGESFSMADVAVATQLLALEMAGHALSGDHYPHLAKHFQRVIARPSFQAFLS